MSWRRSGNVRTSKSWTSRFALGDAELGRRLAHLLASVSGGKPSGSDFVAIENAT